MGIAGLLKTGPRRNTLDSRLRGNDGGTRSPPPRTPLPNPIHLTRTVRFAAAHRYWRDDWSEERNRATFGACANPHGHGHNYVLEVTVAGEPNPETGFVIDLGLLDRILSEEVVVPLDHRHLNHDVSEFGPGGVVPTTENITAYLWKRIEPRIESARLARLRLREDIDLWAEIDTGNLR